MKNQKLLTVLILMLVLSACSQKTIEDPIGSPNNNEHDYSEKDSEAEEKKIEGEIDKENLPIHEEYTDENSWENEKELISDYRNAPFKGEFKNEFNIKISGHELIYRVENKGNSDFTWKIYTPNNDVWNSGTLAPEQSETYKALYDLKPMPTGVYKISIISSDGGIGEFDFTVTSPFNN